MEMLNRFLTWFLCFLSIITQSLSARTLASPPSAAYHQQAHHSISFHMPDVLGDKRLATKKSNPQRPFSKPSGIFPSRGGVTSPSTTNPAGSMPGISRQPLDLEGISMTFPALATLQDMEFGTVTMIDEHIYGGMKFGSRLIGKVEGMYVAGSEDESSHMMAVTASFGGNEFNDQLRLFGAHRPGAFESHIAVIGGTGKYHDANGYATVKTVNEASSSAKRMGETAYKVLQFNVYLS